MSDMAFPSFQKLETFDDGYGEYVDNWLPVGGMSLRDYFAAKAMAAMITTAASPCLLGTDCESQTARAAYVMADAMLEARAK